MSNPSVLIKLYYLTPWRRSRKHRVVNLVNNALRNFKWQLANANLCQLDRFLPYFRLSEETDSVSGVSLVSVDVAGYTTGHALNDRTASYLPTLRSNYLASVYIY